MALVLEDGSGIPDANTYALRATFISFAALRGISVPDALASDRHLILAMDVFDLYSFAGVRTVEGQGCAFPRTNLDERTQLPLWPVTGVPTGITKAQLLLATASFSGYPLTQPVGAGPTLKRRKVGPMEREYFSADANTAIAFVPGVTEAIAPYLEKGGIFNITVTRA